MISRGVVQGTEGGVYQVALESGERVDASLRGRLKRQARTGDRVVIGDEVEIRRDPDGSVTVEEVLPRRTQVIRRGPGGRRPKVIAANVDRLVVVASACRPAPRQALLDRLLVVGEANGLETILVMNKMDLLETEGAPVKEDDPGLDVRGLTDLYRKLGYPTVEASAKAGMGLEAFREVLCSGISALVGPSGVGKSTLLNAVEPGLSLRTGGLSRKAGTGRHTTVSARLVSLACGGLVADTPGFSDVGVWGVAAVALDECFPEFRAFRGHCRFRGCTHLHEPGCEVQEALGRGEIDSRRFESYRTLFHEAKKAEERTPGRLPELS